MRSLVILSLHIQRGLIVHFADRTSALHCGMNALHLGAVEIEVERGFENWKVSGLRAFLLARDVPVCDQAKPVLVQNCYLAVFLRLQAKKSLDEYAQDLGQTINRESFIIC